MEDTTNIPLREYIEYRLDAHGLLLEKLQESLDKLFGTIIAQATFDELAEDAEKNKNEIQEIRGEVREIQTQLRIARYFAALTWLVLGPILVDWIRKLLE